MSLTSEFRPEERVATRFTSEMNAATSPLGVLADLSIACAIASVPAIMLVRQLSLSEANMAMAVTLGVLALSPIILSAGIRAYLRGGRGLVVAWLSERSFPVDNLNALLAGRSDRFLVHFQSGKPVPERSDVQPLLEAFGPYALCEDVDEEDNTMLVHIGILDSKYLPARSAHNRFALFQRMVAEAFEEVHKRFPIDHVRVE